MNVNTFATNISSDRLAEMWCELNFRIVPKELKGHISSPSEENLLPYMRKIESKIGRGVCLEKWKEISRKEQ